MRDTVVLDPGEPPPAGAAAGSWANGRPAAPWPSTGIAPAGGGVWSTTADVARLLAALLEGRAPGAEATRPRRPAGEDLGWITSRHASGTVTWHNGRTGGFATWAGYEPGRRRAIVVLANTDRSVDRVGLRMLDVGAGSGGSGAAGPLRLLLTVAGSLWGGVALLALTRRRKLDRLRVVATALSAVALLALSAALGAWEGLPPALWVAGAGLAGSGLALTALRWPALPVSAGRHPVWRWASTLATGAFAGVVVLLTA